ncbi:MAG: hypothetical protein E7213_00600 [Clostridium sp.]|nr:hypothetical protein [Clostridium sp.]
MVYEYSNENLSKKQIAIMLQKSESIKKNVKNIAYCAMSIFLIIFLLISFVICNYRWDSNNLILLVAYLIGICRVFLKKNVNTEKLEETEDKEKNKEQIIEYKNYIYKYKCDKFTVVLKSDTVKEIIKSNDYTLLCIFPKRLKNITTFTIFIPNDLFGTKEKYNQFISSIKGE